MREEFYVLDTRPYPSYDQYRSNAQVKKPQYSKKDSIHAIKEQSNTIELEKMQAKAMVRYKLSMDQVLHRNFGQHTLNAIKALLERSTANNIEVDLTRVHELDELQALGVSKYGLEIDQVLGRNFGSHTLSAMRILMRDHKALDLQQAFTMVEGLNKIEIKGVISLGLKKEQIENSNFGWHTIWGVDQLITKKWAKSYQEAFAAIKGLNKAQVKRILAFKLTEEQIQGQNFDPHPLNAMLVLIETGKAKNDQEAFTMIEKLNEVQIKGILKFKLTREQVENPSFNKAILNTIQVLSKVAPKAEGSYLYNTAMEMILPYQIRGIVDHDLTLEQVGIEIVKNKFVQQDPEDHNFSENTVNALDIIRSKDPEITDTKAYDIAIELNPSQVLGMTDYGLSLEQVSSQEFRGSGHDILNELFEKINEHLIKYPRSEEEHDIEFPLSKELQQIAREKFNHYFKKEYLTKEVMAKFQSPSNRKAKCQKRPLKPKGNKKRILTI